MRITTNIVPTFTATIYVGLKERSTGTVIDRSIPASLIRTYVDTVGLCVSVTHTQFLYTNGSESGIIVGLINYPRFPSTPLLIKSHALALAEILLKGCKQLKVSVVMPDETVMLSVADLDERQACPSCPSTDGEPTKCECGKGCCSDCALADDDGNPMCPDCLADARRHSLEHQV